MQVDFEHLETLPKILERLENIEKHLQNNYSKRWLTVAQLSEYLGYSKDYIHKLKVNEWVEGYHYYKKTGKIIFDSHIIGIGKSTVWLWTKEGKLPKPIKLSPGITVWEEAKIREWMNQKIEESNEEN